MSRNVPKKSEQIQRFKLKLPLNCWVFFDVAESTVEYCFDVWVKLSPFFYLFNRHLVMAPFRNTKKLQNYACSSNHLLELEKPSDVQEEGGDCHTPLRFSWVFFLDDKTSAPNIFSSCSLSLARILRQVQWWSVSMVSRYDVISSKCSSHFWVKICFISTSINNRSKSCAKCLFMCYFSCQGQKIIISRGFSRV